MTGFELPLDLHRTRNQLQQQNNEVEVSGYLSCCILLLLTANLTWWIGIRGQRVTSQPDPMISGLTSVSTTCRYVRGRSVCLVVAPLIIRGVHTWCGLRESGWWRWKKEIITIHCGLITIESLDVINDLLLDRRLMVSLWPSNCSFRVGGREVL